MVTLAVVVLVGFALISGARQDLDRLRARELESQATALGVSLSLSYQTTRGWDEVGPIIQSWALRENLSVVLEDPFGEAIDAYAAFDTPVALTSAAWVLDTPGFVVGRVVVGMPNPAIWSQLEVWFVTVSYAVLAGLLIGAIVYVLSGQPSRDVGNLTQVATRISRGSYGERAAVVSGSETQELAESINAIASKLKSIDEQRTAVMAEVFHELRRPLTNVQGFTGIMQDEVLNFTERLKDSVSAIYRQVHMLSQQMDGMNFFSALDSGQLELDQQPEDVADLLKALTAGYESMVAERGLQLRVRPDGGLPLVSADRDRIGQVMGNLLDNAIAHTPSGGEIQVAASRGQGHVVISVRDTGEGIDPEVLPHIFERFYSRRTGSPGFGIGLTIAKNIVTLHGGEIWAKSKPGQGTTFSFTLPVWAGHESETPERAANSRS